MVKKQHYIPRFYLRRFSNTSYKNDNKNKILVFDKKQNKVYASNVYNIACENYFYNIDNQSLIYKKQIVEDAFSELEGDFAKLLKKIINICEHKENYFSSLILNSNEKFELSFYIITQILRTNKQRRIIANAHKKIGESRLNLFKEFYSKELEKKLDDDIQCRTNDKEIHLRLLFNEELTISLTNLIYDSCWSFIYNETKIPFIISDDPVCHVSTFLTNDIKHFTCDELDIYFPISQNIAVHIFRKDSKNFEKMKEYRNRLIPYKNKNVIDAINRIQLAMAHERVFINPDHKKLLEKYIGKQ